MNAETQKQIEKLDKRIEKLTADLQVLTDERTALYESLIEEQMEALNELRSKAGLMPALRPTSGMRGRPPAGFASPSGRALTDDQVRDIRKRFAMGVTKKRLALDYGVSSIVIDKLLAGLTYRDVPDEAPEVTTVQYGVPVPSDGDEDEGDSSEQSAP